MFVKGKGIRAVKRVNGLPTVVNSLTRSKAFSIRCKMSNCSANEFPIDEVSGVIFSKINKGKLLWEAASWYENISGIGSLKRTQCIGLGSPDILARG